MKRDLIVEGDLVFARMARALLDHAGWETDGVQTGRRTRVVVVSANEAKSSPRYDVDGVLQKPLRMPGLEEILQRVEATP